ncbi:uncharacterized protein LOC112509200 [Cynara cardunculus var. scolymus]|uniref:Auxin responsive SAUR protein n=1 Tax=Cynara cardunculus var. scolymus TaxID=59895 RepID=A0A124SGE5_CYNCS|nr:uncharacterized protein LOC112509200 [Cynara cardunculus var. scolymus]KVI06148.1 Auxin responsive SAUR protein [Cynara cardunculus var. scolymus]
MESAKSNSGKKNFLVKTWKRCRSFPRSHSSRGGVWGLAKSKSWHGKEMMPKKKKMAPEGFFPVYVGPERQRFAIKTKLVNHPLFTKLLEDAEIEYGYNCDGPISLPCAVDLFYEILAEMEAKDHVRPLEWSFAYGSCSPFNPSRRLGIYGADQMAKGYGSYEHLQTTSLFKMN